MCAYVCVVQIYVCMYLLCLLCRRVHVDFVIVGISEKACVYFSVSV